MPRSQRTYLSALLLGTLAAAGCAQSPTAPTNSATADAASAAAKPGSSLTPGFYSTLFLNNAGEEVTTLPVGGFASGLTVRVIVRDSNGQLAADGAVLFEICRWRGVSPTTGTRGGAAPSARCADGQARWERHISMDVRPDSPLSFTAQAGIDSVNVECTMGWRVTYKNSRTIAPKVMGPTDISWQ